MRLLPTDTPVAAEITRAARSIRGGDDSWVMAYHPVARMNPYQSLLYSRAWVSGFAPVATARLADLTSIRCALPMGAGAAVHLHWTSTVIGDAATSGEAKVRVADFIEQLRQLKTEGVQVIWTVHNRLPHRCEYPKAEVSLRTELAELADVVHIMTPETPAEVRDLFTLPDDRLLLAPHPSYVGAYPMHYDRSLVRFEMGFERDEFVVGLIGSIQPYKGVDELIDAVADPDTLAPGIRVLVAGVPGQDPASKQLVDRLKRVEAIKTAAARLDDQSLAQAVSALDVMVLPYRAALNSGAAMLSLSFGVPLLAPRIGPFRSLAERGYCRTYDGSDPSGLSRALREAPEWVGQVDREAIHRDMAPLSGPAVSDEFFRELRTKLLLRAERHR